jgi:hypothetical protein
VLLLLYVSQISDSALRILSLEILSEKGIALPVGEIGKMLQEATAMSNVLSAALKERYGGLKKFLESNPDDFLISSDHPFNPHVNLKMKKQPSSNAGDTGDGSAGGAGNTAGASNKGNTKNKKVCSLVCVITSLYTDFILFTDVFCVHRSNRHPDHQHYRSRVARPAVE